VRGQLQIVFVNRFFFPDEAATGQLLSDLAFAIAAGGQRVAVVTSSQRYRDGPALPASEVIRGVQVRRVWTPRRRASLLWRVMQYWAFYAGATWHLLRLLRRGDILVALTDPPAFSVPAALVSFLKGAALINWLQDIFPETATNVGVHVPGRGLVASLRNWSLRGAGANVVLSASMGRRIAGLGVTSSAIRRIDNWTNDEAIRPSDSRACALRAEWGLGDRFIVEYSGNMGRAHEFDTILGAAQRLRDESDVVFVFVGDGHALAAIRARTADLALPNVVIKPPQPRARLAEVLGLGDVHLISLQPALEGLVVPSKYYGILAAGRPVLYVGDRDADLAREVVNCQCGHVVAPGEANELAAYIRDLRDDDARRQRMGECARALLDARYTQRMALRRWSELISALAPEPARQRA
jgi:colanic acid biosynthesis glycosyl transferase WcaI